MVVHAEGRHPGDLHDGVEMRELEIAAEECVQANCKTRPGGEEPDPARKRARQKQRGDCPSECDVNGPGDGQGAVKVKSITRVTTLEESANCERFLFDSAGLAREHEIQSRASAFLAVPSVAEWHQ